MKIFNVGNSLNLADGRLTAGLPPPIQQLLLTSFIFKLLCGIMLHFERTEFHLLFLYITLYVHVKYIKKKVIIQRFIHRKFTNKMEEY